jgi:hypothetical protein
MTRQEFKQFLQEKKKDPATVEEIKSHGNTNAWLMYFYQRATGKKTFRTFHGWKEEGFKVRKGESSFPVFSRPSNILKAEKTGNVADYDTGGEKPFFYLCHLYHDGQVEPQEQK